MNITVFGLGIIGSIWADHFQRDGHYVTRWNRTAKQTEGFVSDACIAASQSELLVIVVADVSAVQSVLDQILPVLNSSQIVMQSSTVSPDATRRFADQVSRTGAAFLEAPFTGSKPSAEQRKTVFFAGGDPAVLERVRPVIGKISSAIEHIGPVGSASALKLAMNVNIALVSAALGESLALARAAGIPDERYFSILRLNTSHSRLADIKQPKLQNREFSPQFSLKHMAKDIRMALEFAGALKLQQTQSLMQMYERGMQYGWGDDDFAAIARLTE